MTTQCVFPLSGVSCTRLTLTPHIGGVRSSIGEVLRINFTPPRVLPLPTTPLPGENGNPVRLNIGRDLAPARGRHPCKLPPREGAHGEPGTKATNEPQRGRHGEEGKHRLFNRKDQAEALNSGLGCSSCIYAWIRSFAFSAGTYYVYPPRRFVLTWFF